MISYAWKGNYTWISPLVRRRIEFLSSSIVTYLSKLY